MYGDMRTNVFGKLFGPILIRKVKLFPSLYNIFIHIKPSLLETMVIIMQVDFVNCKFIQSARAADFSELSSQLQLLQSFDLDLSCQEEETEIINSLSHIINKKIKLAWPSRESNPGHVVQKQSVLTITP